MADDEIEDRLNNQLNGIQDDDTDELDIPDEDPDDEDEGGADDVDDQGDDEEDDSGDDSVDAAPAPKKKETKSEATIRRLRRERQERDRELDAMRRQMQELNQRVNTPPAQPQETAAQRAERFALMTPEERSEARLEEAMAVSNRTLAQTQFQTQDMADKMAYQLQAASHPVYARYANEVETRLAAMRAQGQNVSREALLKYIVGEKAMERSVSPAAKKAAKAAKGRVEQQRARPSNGRGDRPATRAKPGSTPRERLDGVAI